MTTESEFLDTYVASLRELNAAVFAGAGLSIPGGMVNWKTLMQSIARDVGLDVEKEHDLVAVAQYHENERRGRHKLNKVLLDEFAARGRVTENHRILARLPIRTYWTTNYDKLIEEGLKEAGKKADVKVSAEGLATTLGRRDAVVYKMHGDVGDPARAVVTRDDYEAYATTARGELFSTALKGDLVSQTFLFLGFSFDDPNLAYVLSRIRVLLGTNRRDHYALMRHVHRADFKKNSEYQYAKVRQDLRVDDLRRYGILAVLLDTFDRITEVLKRLERRHRGTNVFISGSARSYGTMTEPEASRFLNLLGSALTRRGMNVVTGFGLGVGHHIINGVLEELEKEGTRTVGDRLVMRPFPFAISDAHTRMKRWKKYREGMISEAGVAVFVFGNKEGKDGEVIDADGVLEEFELAESMGLLLVPVGATGSIAQKLYARVEADLNRYYPKASGLKSVFRALGEVSNPTHLVEHILAFIEKAQEGRF